MFDRDVKFLGCNLRQGGDGALTEVDSTDHHLYVSIAIHLHNDR